MATITSAQDGDWNTASTWNSGTVPTSADDVYIDHVVTFGAINMTAANIYIRNGSLYYNPTFSLSTEVKLTVNKIWMFRKLNDTRKVRLDGVRLELTTPSISAEGSGESLPPTTGITNISEVSIFDDPGAMGFSAQMQDQKPEGCAVAYARKVSNGVRYMTITWRIRADKPIAIGQLYRMAENPYQVLVSTYSGVIKGYIEAITPIDSVGKEYRAFRISVAEGPSE